jgi:hypothetical protein
LGLAKEIEMKIAQPLATARLYLQLNPNEVENRALRKLLAALADFENAEPIRDTVLFQGELGVLTAALLNARTDGMYTLEQWRQATTY